MNIDNERKITVFIADVDEKEEIYNNFLKFDEFEVMGKSNNGEETLSKVLDLKPDVVILETMLVGVDGFYVLEEVKKVFGESSPKFIFVSNLSNTNFISKAIKEGASYFMVKPINVENLKARVIEIVANSENRQVSKQLDEKIANIFISIGIPAHIKGYQFLREAVKLAVEEPDIIGSITKRLYPTIAERFATSSSKVERGMRHAIEVAWNRGKIENINNLFGLKIYNSNEKPTNGELIALIADKMIMEG